jgi:hypothetical protein
MIEALNVEAHHFKIPTMVFTMTLKAILAPDLRRHMESSAGLNETSDFLVAFEAFGVFDFVTKRMAFRAIGQSFKFSMCSCQCSGRQLRECSQP